LQVALVTPQIMTYPGGSVYFDAGPFSAARAFSICSERRHYQPTGTDALFPDSNDCSFKKLRPFRAAKSVSTDAEQELGGARFWHCFFFEFNFFVPHKMRNPATRGYSGGHPL
jgi:hypothetical protein